MTWNKRTICPGCGVTSVSYVENRLGNSVAASRDHMPCTIVIRLKPETRTTYVFTPEIERVAMHIRGLDKGKLNYAFDTPLPSDSSIFKCLDADERIQEWHTVALLAPDERVPESAVVCESHVNFYRSRRRT